MTKKIHIDKRPEKTKPTNTRLIFILDQSTSMSRMREEAVAGFNEFVAAQRKVDGKANITLVLFDSDYRMIHDQVDLKTVPALDHKTYVPQGMTCLYDAIGRTVSKYKSTEKPGEKTIVTILTDGEENSSKEFAGEAGRQGVLNLLKEVQEKQGWEVLFLGAGLMVQNFAQSVGILRSKVATFDLTGKGVYDAINTVSVANSLSRGDARARSLVASRGVTLADDGTADLTMLYTASSLAQIDPDAAPAPDAKP